MTKQTRQLSLWLLVLLAGCLFVSLLWREPWLWMDEVTSSVLLADPSISHMNRALVSGLDSHPPLFFNLYWLLGHGISLDPIFLKAVSIGFFALAIAIFYRFTTKLTGTPTTNFVLFTAIIGLTYLNYKLATEVRTYSLYLFISCLYFIVVHQLLQTPTSAKYLFASFLTGTALLSVNNFGSFYVVASLIFFSFVWLWSQRRSYGLVVVMHLLVIGIWLVVWYPNAQIQAQAGQPHSWIPVPTFWSSFQVFGELLPAFSHRLEQWPGPFFWPMLRVGLAVGLFFYIFLLKYKTRFADFVADKAFSMYVLAGFIMLLTAAALLVVSLTYMSVFISRCLWPSHLLLLYQAAYASQFIPAIVKARWQPRLASVVPVYSLVLGTFMSYQSQKVAPFPGGILRYLPQLDKQYPVFFESADYFLPIWYYRPVRAYFLLDRPTALQSGNRLNASVDYNILQSLRDYYRVANVVPASQFNSASFPHFYVVDETSRYQIEPFIASGRVRVIRVIPVGISGHRILECAFRH